jgi:hypothetical protein
MPKSADMPKGSRARFEPDRKECPAGLLLIVDFLVRFPDRTDDLLNHEIATRERELIRTQETKYLLSWHPLNTLRFLLISGGLAFFVTWFLGVLAGIGRFYKDLLGEEGVTIPFIGGGISAETFFPAGILDLLSKLPDYGAEEAFFTALAVVALLAVMKAVFILFNWKKIETLRAAEEDLNGELDYLRRWNDG